MWQHLKLALSGNQGPGQSRRVQSPEHGNIMHCSVDTCKCQLAHSMCYFYGYRWQASALQAALGYRYVILVFLDFIVRHNPSKLIF